MMDDVSVDKVRKDIRTIEIGQLNKESNPAPPPSAGKTAVESISNFGHEMSGSDEDEASEVDSFILDENDIEEGEQASKFLLAAEAEGQGIQTVDPQTQARLEALLEAAGISKLSSKDGKALSDPEVLRTLTSSVSSALDEAAQALHRMRDSQGQLVSADGMQLEANGESESLVHRSNSGNVADASEEGESLLSLACSAGYYELAQVLLAMKANVEDRGIKGDCTPLMEAASGGHVDIVRLLLLHNADINAQSSAGNTPLHYGACGGFKEVVQELLLSGANVEIHNENGHTPLMEAASAGHVEVAKILLEHGAGINTHSNEFKESALTLACYKGHLDMVKFLLEAGADQEHKTDEMHTALMEASMDGHVEVARLLLDSGAQVNMPADSFESPLTLAACGGHIELASLLIERGANIEEVNDEGYTPLMEAAREGHEDMVALLLSQGADINAQTEETQETALTLACCGGFLEVADFLLRSGALIELGCSTPLMEAAQEGHLELVSFLLQSGANVEAQTGTGDTALTYACENGHTDVAEALLECGAKLEHESEGGRTPLMKAARAGHLCTVQFLISKGADVNKCTTSNDHTVLSLACAGGHLTVVELLLQHGAKLDHKLKDGSTMVIEAAKGGHTQVVKLLLEWPNRFINNATDQLHQLSVTDAPVEEPRVPVQGLANIVPPSEPDSQLPVSLASAIQAKTPESIRQSMQKSVSKRVNGVQTDAKSGNKFCNAVVPENYPQYFNNTGLMDEKAIDKDEKMTTNQAAKEEQNLKQLSIKKLEQELQEKAQAQLLFNPQPEIDLSLKLKQTPTSPLPAITSPNSALAANAGGKQNEDLAKLLELPGQTLGMTEPLNMEQFNEFAKLLAYSELSPSAATCTETYLQAHLQQHQQQFLLQQQGQPPPPPSPTLVTTTTPSSTTEGRPGGGKSQGSKRNGANKVQRTFKITQPLQQPPPPPPPPPPPSVHSLPAAGQSQAQHIVFQSEHNGASPSAETVSISQQQISSLPPHFEQILLPVSSQQPQLAYPQLMPQPQEQLIQMLNQPNLQQLQLQHISQQHQQQMLQKQQESAQQLLQQQLQQLKGPGSVNHTIATSKPQVVRKQQRVVQTPPANHQNAISNLDITNGSSSPNQVMGMSTNTLYSSVDVDSQTESNHDTALTLACAGGHAELVTLLLAKGADIEHRDKKGFTPLILSATAGHVDVVEILLDHHADIEAQSERTKDTPLSLACSGGRYEVVELLLNRNANKEHRNVSDYTPLSLAASGGYVNIIKLLLSHNAEINSRTGSKLGISPLMLAAMNGHTAAVKLLLDMGSDINAQIETNRNTALTLACFQGRHEVVSLLVDRKANIEHRAKTGLTPLMEAASGGYVEVGRVLLDKGADVNAPPVPSSRDTALTIAADKGHYRFVELLLHRGASVDVKNKKGNSPLWLACNGGHSDVVSLLVQADADIDSQDNRKVSCLMAAFRRGHVKVVKWMVKKVTQFPSENEIKRYIATITDKELQKKCNQCAEIIVSAKDRQAAEANKNADSLLEEIKQEKEQAALKAELASKRRERRRERKKKGKQKDEKPEKDSGKNSSPEPEGELSCNKKDDDEEDDDDEDDSNFEPNLMLGMPSGIKCNQHLASCGKNDNKNHKAKVANSSVIKSQNSVENQQVSRLPPNMTTAAVASSTSSTPALMETANVIPSAATARANRDARKKQQKAARENRREASDQDAGLRSVKAEMNKKQVNQALQVTIAKITTLIESVVTVTAITSQASFGTVTQVSSSIGHGMQLCSSTKPVHNSVNSTVPMAVSTASNASNKEVYLNGPSDGGNKPRVKKSDIIKHSSTTGIGDLDDFGVIPSVLKSFDKVNGRSVNIKKLNPNDKKDWIEEYRYYEKGQTNNRLSSTAPSPRKGQKKEEGWKEVVRKNMSKKLSVPANVISRLIGKGGCNINAIREVSGAHVEVEKSKGNSERTVTIKGYPEAIRHANNLINAMIEEPDKDISELLARAAKMQKAQVEKTQPQKTPVSIADFAIGTFTIPTTSSHSTSTTTSKSPAPSKSVRQGINQSNSGRSSSSTSNSIGPTIGAWQNPVPGQGPPPSPRRSPQKQVTPNSSLVGVRTVTASSSEKSSARQLTFGGDRKRSVSPVSTTSSASLSFSTTATSTMRGVVSSSTIMSSSVHPKSQDPRMQSQIKTALGSPTTVNVRFARPGQMQSQMPLPIVTSGATNHIDRNSQQGNTANQPGEYSPFNNSLFTSFLAKKEEQADKMDFASVAAAGVVTTSPSTQTTSIPTSVVTNDNGVDPQLQAKAPGYKIQRGNSPPYRSDLQESNMANYRIPAMGNVPGMGLGGMNPGIRHGMHMHPYMDHENYRNLLLQHFNQQYPYKDNAMISHLRMDMSGGIPITHFPQNMIGIPMPPGQQQLPQKEEYSKPHRPMTLPEIKGALNPNAPEFQLPSTGPQMLNGYDRSTSNLLSGMVNIGMPDGRPQVVGVPEGPSPNASPNPGSVMTNLNQGNLPQMMPPEMLGQAQSLQYLLQQANLVNANNGGSPPQHNTNRMNSGVNPGSLSHSSPPQGLIGQPGISPGGISSPSFLSQSQPQRAHSPMQNLPVGRPNSAPSMPQDAGLLSGPRSGSPLSTRTPPVELNKTIQPIGGERKKGPVRPVTNPPSFGTLWNYNNSSANSIVYQRIPDAEEERMEYNMQPQVQYTDAGGVPGSDGDHNSMAHVQGMLVQGMYGNGPYPMGHIYHPKGAAGDSQTPPLWNTAMTSAPSDQNDLERWQSWNQ
ncbi:ankyrin repeat domain-containing protein 17-like isoform X2 [Physella acuta]|uniref:ankyrin repeat domain-containing protein 17-like isoform X2 n=1 Tax=Physella acuta TaxID=109671 RepID=UPI0027DD6F73|nr:ankyrin repeat domain-containing protein 17-like isoform X2 [Physella acuta]